MSLALELDSSSSTIVDCVRLAAVWVGHIDHDFSEVERDAILARLPDRPDGMALERIVEHVRNGLADPSAVEISAVFAYIRGTLSPESREPLLRLTCEIVAADGRVSVGERHALAFLADLVSLTTELPRIFEDETGLRWTVPPDLSDAGYWKRIESETKSRKDSSAKEADDKEKKSSADSGDKHGIDPRQVEALAVLGLVGQPTEDEIKSAYRRLTKVHHPDRFHGLDQEAVQHATRAFQRIRSAYEVLIR